MFVPPFSKGTEASRKIRCVFPFRIGSHGQRFVLAVVSVANDPRPLQIAR